MNTRGESTLLSFIFLFAVALIALSIVVGVSTVCLQDVDVRGEHARILADRIASSLVVRGELVEGSLSDQFDVFAVAHLNPHVFIDSGDFYLRVEILGNEGETHRFIEGNRELFEIECGLSGPQSVECYVLTVPTTYAGADYLVRIVSISNQLGSEL